LGADNASRPYHVAVLVSVLLKNNSIVEQLVDAEPVSE